MCGITGIMDTTGRREIDKALLLRMNDLLSHRGPDGDGLAPRARASGLGHRRLSIIDLAGGKQPLYNEDGTVALTYNGEIYNYRELMDRAARGRPPVPHPQRLRGDRARLGGVGRPPASSTSTACTPSRCGTRITQTLFAARDRVGIKPLHYALRR